MRAPIPRPTFDTGRPPCAGDYVRAQHAGCFFLKRIASHHDDAVVVARRLTAANDHEADDAAADDEQRLTGLGRVPQHGVERAANGSTRTAFSSLT